MKQTSVEWLLEQLAEQAKEMEKQQIIDKDGEQYYNETFKSE
jgi:hypothetical protein